MVMKYFVSNLSLDRIIMMNSGKYYANFIFDTFFERYLHENYKQLGKTKKFMKINSSHIII
jgi:hypothetical protein